MRSWGALTLALVLATPSLAPAATPVFGSPTAVDVTAATDTATDGAPRIATDGHGTWLAVWASTGTLGTDSDILVARSTNLGVSWSSPVPVNTTASADEAFDFAPALATDGRGTWVVTWTATNGADTDVFLARSLDAGATWSAPAPLYADAGADTGNDDHPQIATDGDTWMVVWDSTGRFGNDRDVLVARSLDGGLGWSAPAPVAASAATDRGADQRPQLATDGSGTWMVVWTANDGSRGGDFDVLRTRSTDGGVTWTAPAALNGNAAGDAALDDRPQIATDGQGTWVAVWVSDDDLGGTIGGDLDLLTVRSTDGGATWSAPAPLNGDAANDAGADGGPALATDRHGTWVAVWESDASAGGDTAIVMAHSLDGGAHWSAPHALDPAAAADQRRDLGPQLATDGRGMWNAVWTGVGGTLGADGDVLRSGGRERCGNGTVDPGEQCDDGNTLGGDACPASCELPPPPTPLATWTPSGNGGTGGGGTPTPAAGDPTPGGSGSGGGTPTDGGTSGPNATATATAVDPNATPVATASPDPAATPTPTFDPAATATATPLPTGGAPTATAGNGRPSGGTATPTAGGPHATGSLALATPTPAPPRFGGRLTDPGAAKAAVTCQRAVAKAGVQLIGKRLSGFGSCGRGVQRCIQTQPDDPACLAKATARCQSALRGLEALDVKTAAGLRKRCGGRLTLADVLGGGGLGYAALAPACGVDGDGELDDLLACVVGEHACRAATLFELVQPRAKELMRIPGMNAATLDTVVCLPDHGGAGDTFGDPTGVGKAVDVCASAIVKAGTGFVRKRLARLSRCMDALFTCVQLKPDDGACLAKARTRCDGGASASAVEERTLTSAVGARCNESVIAYASLRAARAANLDALADTCAEVGVPTLDTLADYQQCLLRAEACRVEGVLRVQAPRIAELLGLVGRGFGGAHCPGN